MRKSYVLIAGAALLAACSKSSNSAMDADLQKDLEVASSSDGITLSDAGSGTQVVSAIEQTAPPARQKAPSTRVRHHVAAPKSPPRVVRAKAPARVTQDEEQSVAMNPSDDAAPVSPRPRPVAVSYPSGSSSGGDDGRVSSGSGAGAILGTILGAVIRGGAVGDIDHCDPRTDSRRTSHGGILIGTRVPGRIGGTGRVMPSGGNTASRFPH